jgi:hypothetical protein
LTASEEWSASANVTWLTIDPSSGHGSAFVNVTCQTGSPAEGKIIFSTSKSSVQISVYRGGSYYPEGFWVSNSKQIVFSQGNLQYQPSTKTWKFAEHQYDIIGENNKNVINDYQSSEWMDLFPWGTSGYVYSPIGIIEWRENWGFVTSPMYNGDIAGTNYDWGVYNKISNGGNQAGLWRTLTDAEWTYLYSERPNAKKLKEHATVNGIEGLILLPNGWQTPDGVTSTSGAKYNLSTWKKMEQAGAIFLPNPGASYIYEQVKNNKTYISTFYDNSSYDWYWSSSRSIAFDYDAYIMDIGCSNTNYSAANQRFYLAVRLVQDVQ